MTIITVYTFFKELILSNFRQKLLVSLYSLLSTGICFLFFYAEVSANHCSDQSKI